MLPDPALLPLFILSCASSLLLNNNFQNALPGMPSSGGKALARKNSCSAIVKTFQLQDQIIFLAVASLKCKPVLHFRLATAFGKKGKRSARPSLQR